MSHFVRFRSLTAWVCLALQLWLAMTESTCRIVLTPGALMLTRCVRLARNIKLKFVLLPKH